MKVRHLLLLPAALITFTSSGRADVIDVPLLGSTSMDRWDPASISAASNPGYPGATGFASNWPRPIQSPYGGDAILNKTANGATGAPIPSGGSIYFVSFSNFANTKGGTLSITDDTPLAGVKTLAFQLEIGGANGYDLHNNDLSQPRNLSSVVLHYTTASGSGSLPVSSHKLLDRFYTFAIDMPVGGSGEYLPVDVYNRLYGMQWDLSSVTEPITSLRVEFSGVEHSQVYHMRVDQTDHAYGTTSVFPDENVWTATAADTGWNTGGNWQGGAVPAAEANVRLASGAAADLGSTSTPVYKAITFSGADGFTLSSNGNAALSLSSGINASSPGTVAHTISAPLHLANYNLFELAAGNTLTISSAITGQGFYKQGAGHLRLTGESVLDPTSSSFLTNGLIFNGGLTTLSGSTTYAGTDLVSFNIRPDTVVRLAGDVDPADRKFIAHLLGGTSHLQLGDETGPVAQTLAALTGTLAGVTVTGSKVTGGNSALSTLTLGVPSGTWTYGGDIGGTGQDENQLRLVKTGPGTQLLLGNITHSGGTIIREGGLGFSPGAQTVSLDGGVWILPANHSATLGAGISFLSSGGFAAHDFTGNPSSSEPTARSSITLNGGATLSWGMADFLPEDGRLILSASGTNRTIQLTNPLDVGSAERVLHIGDGQHNTDAHLSAAITGTGSVAKTGTGILLLTGSSTYTGATRMHVGGATLSGPAGSLTGPIKVESSAHFRITNTNAENLADRLGDTAAVSLNGGILYYTAAPAGTTETTGALIIPQGVNTLSTTRAGSGAVSRLTFQELTRSPGSTLNFSGTGVGATDGMNQVHFTTLPVPDNGLIGGWAVTANEFATYDANYGVTAYAAYDLSAESAWEATSNVKLSAGTTLTAPREISSLRLVGTSSGTVGNVLGLGGHTFSVRGGGILVNSGSTTRPTRIENGTLTSPRGELILTTNGPTDITATIADPAPGTPLTLTKSGSTILTVFTPATHTGPTYINQSSLKLSATASLAASPLIHLQSNGTLNVEDHASPYPIPATQTLAGNGTVTGNLEVAGTLAPSPRAARNLQIDGTLSLASGSVLQASFDAVGAAVLHARVDVSGAATLASGAVVKVSSPDTDFTSDYWKSPRSFTLLQAASATVSGLPGIDPASDGTARGFWNLSTTATSLVLNWLPSPGGIAAWRQRHFGTMDNSGDAADMEDPDHDGVPNLIEYALGTDPRSANSGPAVTADGRFTFTTPTSLPEDLTYEVQFSDDLEEWTTLARRNAGGAWTWLGEGTPGITETPSGNLSILTIGDAPSPAPARRFARLKTSILPPP